MDLFHALLEKVGFSLGGRALSFALRGLGCCCSAGLALTVGFALRALLRLHPYDDPFRRGDIRRIKLRVFRRLRRTPLSAMHPPKRIRTKNDSLLHHNPSRPRRLLPPRLPIDSASNNGENEERYSFTYIKPGSAAHEAMKESCLLTIVRDKFKEWESIGKMDGHHIDKTNEELAQA